MRGTLSLLVVVAALAPAQAEPSPAPMPGRYALARTECQAGQTFLTLAKDRLNLPVMSCTGLSFQPETAGPGDRAGWHVAAKRCVAEGEGKPGPRRFRIEAQGTALRIHWADGTRSALMARCGP